MAYELKALREAADQACDRAFSMTWHRSAINWGDFGCVSAEHWNDDGGEEGYRVLLEEADPSNQEVGEFIAGELAKAGFHNIEVVFEW